MLLQFTDKGIFCPRAGIYIDPWKPVARALIGDSPSKPFGGGEEIGWSSWPKYCALAATHTTPDSHRRAAALAAIGQDVAEFSRKSFEDASAAIKGFSEVKSPVDFFRLQGEFARASTLFAESLALQREQGDRTGSLSTLRGLASGANVWSHMSQATLRNVASCGSGVASSQTASAVATAALVIGITYLPPLVRMPGGDTPTAKDVLAHIAYCSARMGVEHVGIGSDFIGPPHRVIVPSTFSPGAGQPGLAGADVLLTAHGKEPPLVPEAPTVTRRSGLPSPTRTTPSPLFDAASANGCASGNDRLSPC